MGSTRENSRKWINLDLKLAIVNSVSYGEVLRKLNLVPAGGNYRTLKKYINLLKLDVSHFKGKGHSKGKKLGPKKQLEELLVCNSHYNTYHLRNRLIKEKILDYKCLQCGIFEWNEKLISLELDHINGNNKDNRLENLRLLCPNCHSQTATFRNKSRPCGETVDTEVLRTSAQ